MASKLRRILSTVTIGSSYQHSILDAARLHLSHEVCDGSTWASMATTGNGGSAFCEKMHKLPAETAATSAATAAVGWATFDHEVRDVVLLSPTGASVPAVCSVSSLSHGAASCGPSTTMEHSVPQFVAKSPALVKAKMSLVGAAAEQPPALPRLFTLRGTRQTQGQHRNDHNGRASATIFSPSKPSLRAIIRLKTGDAESYSSSLRMMGGQGRTGEHATITLYPAALNIMDSSSPASPTSGFRSAVECGTTPATNAVCRLKPSVCPDTTTPCVDGLEKDGHVVCAAENSGRTGTPTDPHPRDHAMPSQAHRLCGRLWTGTTTSPKRTHRPNGGQRGEPAVCRSRTLFLVSGQRQQQLDNTAANKVNSTACARPSSSNMARQRRNSQTKCCERSGAFVSAASPPPTSRRVKTAPPGGRSTSKLGRKKLAGGRRRDDENAHKGGGDGARRGNEERSGSGGALSLPKSTNNTVDGDCYDAPTVESTAGNGDGNVRRVLHVRVPLPPPTSLLVLRSAPPVTKTLPDV